MKKSILKNKKAYLLGIIFVLFLWQILAVSFGNNEMLFPGPVKTIKKALMFLQENFFYKDVLMSLKRMLIGFGLSFIFALILGCISGNSPYFENFLQPLITSIRAIPTASLVFVLIAISGSKNAPIYIVMLVCFPILYEGINGGIKNIDRSIIQAAKIDGSSFLNEMVRIRVPLALPYVLVSFASSFGLSFKTEIMAEVISGSTNSGIGTAINNFRKLNPTDLTDVFAYSFIAILIMMIIDYGCNLIKNKIV